MWNWYLASCLTTDNKSLNVSLLSSLNNPGLKTQDVKVSVSVCFYCLVKQGKIRIVTTSLCLNDCSNMKCMKCESKQHFIYIYILGHLYAFEIWLMYVLTSVYGKLKLFELNIQCHFY